jgi:hypothetical protein
VFVRTNVTTLEGETGKLIDLVAKKTVEERNIGTDRAKETLAGHLKKG